MLHKTKLKPRHSSSWLVVTGMIAMTTITVASSTQAYADTAFQLQIKGEQAAAAGQWRKATSLLVKALAERPGDDELIRLTARAARNSGDYEQAEQVLQNLVGESPFTHYGLGLLRVHQERWHEAINLLETFLQSKPDHAHALIMLSVAQFESGEYETAYKNILKGGSKDPTFKTEALVMAAEAKHRLGDENLPKKALKKALPEAQGFIARRAESFLAYLENSHVDKKRWLGVVSVDALYNTNKPFFTDEFLKDLRDQDGDAFKRDLQGESALQGGQAFLSAYFAGDAVVDPFQLRIGYSLRQQIFGWGSATYLTRFSEKSATTSREEKRIKAESSHSAFIDFSKYISSAGKAYAPGFELGIAADVPGYKAGTFAIIANPRFTLFSDVEKSITAFLTTNYTINQIAPSNSYFDLGGRIEAQLTQDSAWRFVQLAAAVGSQNAGTNELDFVYQTLELRFKQNLGTNLFADLIASGTHKGYGSRADSRNDALVTGNIQFGYQLPDRLFFIAATYLPALQLSNVNRFDKMQHAAGLRLGSAF